MTTDNVLQTTWGFLRHKLWWLSRHTYHRPEIVTVTNTRFMSSLLLLHSEHTYIMTTLPRNCVFCHGVAACHGFRDWSYYRPESRFVVNNKIPLLPAVVGTWVERKPIGYNQIKYLSMVRVQSKLVKKGLSGLKAINGPMRWLYLNWWPYLVFGYSQA